MSRSEPNDAGSRVRKIAAVVVSGAGFSVALWQLDGYYPVRSWLVWVFVQIWLLCGVWVLACLCAGHAILRHARSLCMPFREHLLFAFALGVLIFATGIFAIGLVGRLDAFAFVAWPSAMIASGLGPLWRLARRAWRHLHAARRRPGLGRPSPAAYAIFLFGALGVIALYFNILTPANVAYDSRWYHLALAEHYTAAHAITRFPEGWFGGTLPQLASHLYTWAFLRPGEGLATHIELAAHLEFVLFLATLAGLPLLVRWLLHGARAPFAWTALFLFPGIFVYDSAPSAAADHVLAFWAVPLLLAARRFFRTWALPEARLLAAMAAGAALTKYQAIYFLIPLAVAVSIRVLVLLWRRGSARAALLPPLACAASIALLTAAHWLKNLVWYGDPLYPTLHGLLRLRPWNLDAEPDFHMQPPDFVVQGTLLQKLLASVKALGTVGLQSHDFPPFHRDWPVFGFLFTLLVPCVLLLKGAARLRILAGATLSGVFVWYWTLHEDRYLQALLPWMAALVAAVIVRLWRMGISGRLSIIPLLALQITWGGDHYFLPSHAMLGQQPLRSSMDMIASGFQGRLADRFALPSNLIGAGKALPSGARALIHEQHQRLGIGVPAVSDARGTQGALSYRRQRSPRELWLRLRALGVTHVVWPASPMGIERWADEAVFYDFATKYLVAPAAFAGVILAALPTSPPPAERYGPVAVLGCRVARQVPLEEVDTAIFGNVPPPSEAASGDAQRGADFILIETACRRPSAIDPKRFALATTREGWQTWARRP